MGGTDGTNVSSQNQIVDYAHYSSHCRLHAAFSLVRTREFDRLPIAKEAAREKLVVDIERGCAQIVGFHCARELAYSEGSREFLTW